MLLCNFLVEMFSEHIQAFFSVAHFSLGNVLVRVLWKFVEHFFQVERKYSNILIKVKFLYARRGNVTVQAFLENFDRGRWLCSPQASTFCRCKYFRGYNTVETRDTTPFEIYAQTQKHFRDVRHLWSSVCCNKYLSATLWCICGWYRLHHVIDICTLVQFCGYVRLHESFLYWIVSSFSQ